MKSQTELQKFKALKPEFDQPGPIVYLEYSWQENHTLEIILVELKGKYKGTLALDIKEVKDTVIVNEEHITCSCGIEAYDTLIKALFMFGPLFEKGY